MEGPTKGPTPRDSFLIGIRLSEVKRVYTGNPRKISIGGAKPEIEGIEAQS